MFSLMRLLIPGFGMIKVGLIMISLVVGTGFLKSCSGSALAHKYSRAEVKNLQGVLSDNVEEFDEIIANARELTESNNELCENRVQEVAYSSSLSCDLKVAEAFADGRLAAASEKCEVDAEELRGTCEINEKLAPEILDILRIRP